MQVLGIMESVDIIKQEGENIYFENIFGERLEIKARIKEMNLVDHRILLVENQTVGVSKKQEALVMDFIEKARIRLESWVTHNDHHQEEYEMFAERLEEAGKKESLEHFRKMMEMTAKSNEYLRKAFNALE